MSRLIDPVIENIWRDKISHVSNIMNTTTDRMSVVLRQLFGPESKGSIFEDYILNRMIECYKNIKYEEHAWPVLKSYIKEVDYKLHSLGVPIFPIMVNSDTKSFGHLIYNGTEIKISVNRKIPAEFLEAEILPRLFAQYAKLTGKVGFLPTYYYLGGAGISSVKGEVVHTEKGFIVNINYENSALEKFIKYCGLHGHGYWRPIPIKVVVPPNYPNFNRFSWSGRPVLCLDIDETLVYARDYNPHTMTPNLIKRPGLDRFIDHVSKKYDIVIFTAAESLHADKVLSIIDPDTKWSFRRLYREDCTFYNGVMVKDLRVIGVDMKKIILLDNSAYSGMFTPDNLYLIDDYMGETKDAYLDKIIPVLDTIFSMEDVRPILRNTFHLNKRFISS